MEEHVLEVIVLVLPALEEVIVKQFIGIVMLIPIKVMVLTTPATHTPTFVWYSQTLLPQQITQL